MHSTLLIVDDDPLAVQVMARLLSDLGEIFVATDGALALEVARECRPDVVVLDGQMPVMNGFDVCAAFKADPLLADVPIVFVSANSEPEFELSGFDLGAADFIAKPFSGEIVRARVQTQLKIKHMSDELRRLATEDSLTGAATRRAFDDALHREVALAQRNGRPLTVLMLDIDHFKRFNDHYGHPAGDACLRAVATAIGQACRRPSDLLARIGGEEFAVVLPETTLGDAAHVAARALAAVAELDIPHHGVSERARVSISAGAGTAAFESRRGGAAEAPPPADCVRLARLLVSAADKALYAAKRNGRRRAYGLTLGDGADQPVELVEPGSRSAAHA